MLNHTYTSVNNANLVDCGKKQHIPSQPFPLIKENYLGEFRTELDKKKVLANLGIATSLSLEWEYIKGDIGRSDSLMQELDSRTQYISQLDGFQKSVIEGLKHLETIVGGEEEGEELQNTRLTALELGALTLTTEIDNLKTYLSDTVEVDINRIENSLQSISEKVNNITNLIQVSAAEGNALSLLYGENAGLYVPDLSKQVQDSSDKIVTLRTDVTNIQESLDTFVTKEELGGGDFDFVDQGDFDTYVTNTNNAINSINDVLKTTVKTGEDGHVDTLYVNTISKNNDDGNIKVTDSFEMESGIPLDVRFVVADLDALTGLSAKVCYPGMGVIVNSVSSLYILRNPGEGVKLTQEYVGNLYNWKCPEDLVTVALTYDEYKALEEVNPNVFYYIYEDEIKRTTEPKREEYPTEEEFNTAWHTWVNSLKQLSQEYMSASWGVDIENKVSKKANQVDVTSLNTKVKDLQTQIDTISGGDGDTSLSSLDQRLEVAEDQLLYLLGSEDDVEPNEKGKISEIEESIQGLNSKVEDEYVSKASIMDENNTTDYIFLKKSEYSQDVKEREDASKKSITTETLTATEVVSDSITLSSLPITVKDDDLLINNKEVAVIEDVPKIIYLTQAEYDALDSSEIDKDAYYYTTNDDTYVTRTAFDTKLAQLNTTISAQSSLILDLQKQIEQLIETVEALKVRVDILENGSDDDTAELPE